MRTIKVTKYDYSEYQTKKINKMKENLHIRAVFNPEKQKMSYYFGLLAMASIGSSEVINGTFVMSSKLKQFVERMRLN